MNGLYVYSKYNRLSGHQLSTLMQLRVSAIYHTFTLFVEWAVEGRYDFHMLPYALKTRLNPGDVDQLKEIQTLYKKGLLLLKKVICCLFAQKLSLCYSVGLINVIVQLWIN